MLYVSGFYGCVFCSASSGDLILVFEKGEGEVGLTTSLAEAPVSRFGRNDASYDGESFCGNGSGMVS